MEGIIHLDRYTKQFLFRYSCRYKTLLIKWIHLNRIIIAALIISPPISLSPIILSPIILHNLCNSTKNNECELDKATMATTNVDRGEPELNFLYE